MVEFDHFRKEAGLPTFTLSVSNWVEMTNAKGIYSVKGRYGGTYAHKDIAFEFGSKPPVSISTTTGRYFLNLLFNT